MHYSPKLFVTQDPTILLSEQVNLFVHPPPFFVVQVSMKSLH